MKLWPSTGRDWPLDPCFIPSCNQWYLVPFFPSNFHRLLLFDIARLAYPVIYWTFLFLSLSPNTSPGFPFLFFISFLLIIYILGVLKHWIWRSGLWVCGLCAIFRGRVLSDAPALLLLLIMEDYHNHITTSIWTLTSFFSSFLFRSCPRH